MYTGTVRLVLWDIDGTLVDTSGHGRDAFEDALRQVLGRPPTLGDIAMSGRTDHSIALEIMAMGGVDDPELHLPSMYEALHAALKERARAIAAEGAPQPGVREAIAAIDERGGAIQSLLTGNIEPNAHVKLGAHPVVGPVATDLHVQQLVDPEGAELHMRVRLDVAGEQ